MAYIFVSFTSWPPRCIGILFFYTNLHSDSSRNILKTELGDALKVQLKANSKLQGVVKVTMTKHELGRDLHFRLLLSIRLVNILSKQIYLLVQFYLLMMTMNILS